MEKLMASLKTHGHGTEMPVSFTLINQQVLVFLTVMITKQ